ncbi:acyl carrier protein [Alistipes timonensis]|uniref:acyl carrier protein n=1 Tax=Alistipes timonensis TaxID=1465754 RepID=UPI00189B1025|nr:acyl carrier protein [Alistipes timonensis]
MKRKIRTARAYAMALALAATISMTSCQTQDYSTDLTLNNGQEYIQDNSRVKATRSNITATRTVFKKVQAIICDHVNISPGQIQLGSIIRNDLGFDSLDFIEIIMSVEEEFGISIPDEAIDSLITIEDLVVFINTNLSSHPAIFTKLLLILEEQINISKGQVDTYSNLNTDLGMDSLDFFELIIAVEEEYDIQIPDEDLKNIVTAENLVVYIAAQIEQQQPPVDPPVDPPIIDPVPPVDPPITDPDLPADPTDIENWLKETLSMKTGTPTFMLTRSTRLIDDLEMDEVDILDFKLAVESHFGILIFDDRAAMLLTIGDWITYIESRAPGRPLSTVLQ